MQFRQQTAGFGPCTRASDLTDDDGAVRWRGPRTQTATMRASWPARAGTTSLVRRPASRALPVITTQAVEKNPNAAAINHQMC